MVFAPNWGRMEYKSCMTHIVLFRCAWKFWTSSRTGRWRFSKFERRTILGLRQSRLLQSRVKTTWWNLPIFFLPCFLATRCAFCFENADHFFPANLNLISLKCHVPADHVENGDCKMKLARDSLFLFIRNVQQAESFFILNFSTKDYLHISEHFPTVRFLSLMPNLR